MAVESAVSVLECIQTNDSYRALGPLGEHDCALVGDLPARAFSLVELSMNTMIIRYLAIAAAGSVGAVLRYVLANLIGRINIRFPLGTFIINITGSLFLGWFVAYATRHNLSDNTRLAIGVGFVGAYTTFSTFMFESNRLVDEGASNMAMLNLVASLVVGIIAVRIGLALGR
jgi:CrcB protein